MLRRLKQTLCAPGPRDRTETETELFECLLRRYGSAVASHRGRGSGCRRPGYGVSSLGGGCHLPQHRTYTGWGNRLLEGTNRTLCAPVLRRKKQWPQKRLTQTCPGVLRSLQQKHGSVVAWWRVVAVSVAVPAWDLYKEVAIIFITSTIV